MAVNYWCGDEDFPSSCKILFDSSASHYLPTDVMRHPGKYAERQDSKERRIGSKITGMKKEAYFAEETIQEKSRELLEFVAPSRRRHADIIFRPEKAALLVLDMQEYFLRENSHAFVPSAPAIISGINKLIAAFEEMKQPVIATRHINTEEDAGMMSRWWRDLIRPQNAHSQLHQ